MIDFVLTYLPEILLIAFGFVVFLQILYYGLLFSRFSFHKLKTIETQNKLPVSIVIVAKNDAHFLIKTLPELLSQDYPQYEVVVVSDNSYDETSQLVKDFQNRFPNLKLIDLESSVTNIKGKKFPLSLGIKAATYEHVLLTDVDCLPTTTQWISLMARHFNETTKIVLGYNSVRKKIGFVNAFARYDKLHQALQYFSYCLAKIPYMGMGQNLSYTKSIFFNNKGFASQNHLRFGDDDLFINRVATASNCAIEYQKDAHTISRSSFDFSQWLSLKIFRSRTRSRYTKLVRFLLNFYHFLMPISYILLGFVIYATLHNYLYFIIAMGVLFVKLVALYVSFGFAAVKLNEKALIPHILMFDILLSALNPIIYIASKFKEKK